MFSTLRSRIMGTPQPPRVEVSKLGEQQVFEPGRLIDLYQFNCRYEVYNNPSASYARNKRLAVCNASLPNELKGKLERIAEANPYLREKLSKVINLSIEMKNLIRFFLTKGSCGGMVTTLKGDRSVDIKIRFVQESQDYEITIYFEKIDFDFEDIEIISTVTPFVSNKQLKVLRERILRKKDEGIQKYRQNRREYVLGMLENVILENPISRTKTMTYNEQRIMKNTLTNKKKLKSEKDKYIHLFIQSLQKNYENLQINKNITMNDIKELFKLTPYEIEIFFFICYNEYIIYSHQKNKVLLKNKLTETGSQYSIEHMVCDSNKVLSIGTITKKRKNLFKTSITMKDNVINIIENIEKINEELDKYSLNLNKMLGINHCINELLKDLNKLNEGLDFDNLIEEDRKVIIEILKKVIELFTNNQDLRRIYIENYIGNKGIKNKIKAVEILDRIIQLSNQLLIKIDIPKENKKRKINEITNINIEEESEINHVKRILNNNNLEIQNSIEEEYEGKIKEFYKNIKKNSQYFVGRMIEIYQIFGKNIQYQIDEKNYVLIYKNFIRIMVLTLNNPKVKYLLDHVLYKDLTYDTFYSSFKKEILESSVYQPDTENISFYDLNIDLIQDTDSRLIDHIYMFSDYFIYHEGLNNYFDILCNNILYSFSEEGLLKKNLNINVDIQNERIDYTVNVPALNELKESIQNIIEEKIQNDNHYLIRILNLVQFNKKYIQFLIQEIEKNNDLNEEFNIISQSWRNNTKNQIKELDIKNFLQKNESRIDKYSKLKDLLIYIIHDSKIISSIIQHIIGQQKSTSPTEYSFNLFYFFNDYYKKVCETNGFNLFYIDLMYLIQQYYKDENLYGDLDYFMLYTFILSKVEVVNQDHIFYKKAGKNELSPYPTGSARRFTDCVRNNTYFMDTTFSYGKINILETFIFQGYKQDNNFFDILYNYILKFIKDQNIRQYFDSLIFDLHKGILSDGMYIKLKIKRLRELFNEFINQYFKERFTLNYMNEIYTKKIDTYIFKIPSVFNIAGYPYLFTLTNNNYTFVQQPYRLMFENIYQFIQDNKKNENNPINIMTKNVLYLIHYCVINKLKLEDRTEENRNLINIYESNFKNINSNNIMNTYENYLELLMNIYPTNTLFKDFCQFIQNVKQINLRNIVHNPKSNQYKYKYFYEIGLLKNGNMEDSIEICRLYSEYLKRPSFTHYQISSFFGYFAQILKDQPINQFIKKNTLNLLNEVYNPNYTHNSTFIDEEKYQSYLKIYNPIQELMNQIEESLQNQRINIERGKKEIIHLEGLIRQSSGDLEVILTNKNKKMREYDTMFKKAKMVSSQVLKNSKMPEVIQISSEIEENSPNKFIQLMEEKYERPPERRMILRKDPYYQNPEFREFINEFKRRTEEMNVIRKANQRTILIKNKTNELEEKRRLLKQKEDELENYIQEQKRVLIPIRQQLMIRNINNINDIDKMLLKITKKLSILNNQIEANKKKKREFFDEKKKIINNVRIIFNTIIQYQSIMENPQIKFILENLPNIYLNYSPYSSGFELGNPGLVQAFGGKKKSKSKDSKKRK